MTSVVIPVLAIGTGIILAFLFASGFDFAAGTGLILAWDGSTCTSYLNGIFDNSDTTTGNTLAFSDGSNYLGYIDNYGYWNGLMDDIRIYNRVLELEEIQVLANQ